MKDNDEKIKQLNEWQEKLEKIAKEMYDIKEYENVKDEEEKEKSLNEKKNALIKKYEVGATDNGCPYLIMREGQKG